MQDNSLHPDHLADLNKSGLSDEMIKLAGIHTVPPGEIARRMGANYPQVKSALSFPYNGNGFERLKLFPGHKDRNGHSVRYFQKAGTENHLYVPPGVEQVLLDANTPFRLTEGEKKALKATQEGIPCIGIGGVWNWEPDLFDKFAILDRNIEVVPDSDFLTNRDVLLAIYRLGKVLERRGGKVAIVCLPEGAAKCGFDDFLVSHTVDEYLALKRISLAHDVFTKNKCAEADKSTTRQNKKDLIDEILATQSKPAIRPAQDFVDGNLFYGLALGVHRVFACSDRTFTPWDDFLNRYRVLDKSFCKSKLSADGIEKWRTGGSVSASLVFDHLRQYFSKFVIYRSLHIPEILSLWTMGTYLYQVFRWFPYLWLNSPTRRSGKSLLQEVIGYVAFNATSGTANASESWVFREVSANGATLILDELENLGNADKEKAAALMGILNVGFKKDGTVGRVDKHDKSFLASDYHVYSPKCLAGISQLADTVVDRCLKISLWRKKKTEKVSRFSPGKIEPELNLLRDSLYLFGLQYAKQIHEMYEEIEQIGISSELDDRAKDILEPLFAIAALIDAERNDGEIRVFKLVEAFAKEQAGIRASQEIEDEATSHVVRALQATNFNGLDQVILTPDDILLMFRDLPELVWVDTKKKAGGRMRALGLVSKTLRLGNEVRRGYLLTPALVEDLKERFLPPDSDFSSVTSVTPDGKPEKNASVTKPFVTDEFSPTQTPLFSTVNAQEVTGVTDQNL